MCWMGVWGMGVWGMGVRGMGEWEKGVWQDIMYSSGRWVFGGAYFDGYNVVGDGYVAGHII